MALPQKISPQELRLQIDTVDMRSQLFAQIVKDLGIEPWSISAEAPDFFSKLEEELFYTLTAIIERQPQLLPNIIYRIDLVENKVKLLLADPEANAARVLTEMVLHREMQKVFYRNVYSGKIKI